VTLDDQPQSTPLDVSSVVGVKRELGVVSPQDDDAQTYVFESWSDGRAGSHEITTPSTATTYTATYAVQEEPPVTTLFYLSLEGSQTVGGLAFAPQDIIAARSDGSYAVLFDGSDVGLSGRNIDAFDVISGSDVLLSFTGSFTLPGQYSVTGAAISVDDSDVIRFSGNLGATTTGNFRMYFDGSDVGLTNSSEDIDALALLPDGSLLISTTGSVSLPGRISGVGQDVFRFSPASGGLGDDSSAGTWSWYIDGSDIGLSSSSENIDGIARSSAGALYLSTTGNFSVTRPGGTLTGADEDVFVFNPTSTGSSTAGTFSANLAFDGSSRGIAGNDISGVDPP
jgi:hypothetical protein